MSTTPKLHQVLAIEKGLKVRVARHMTEATKSASRPDLFNGLATTYTPKDGDADRYPPESKRVQVKAPELLRETAKLLTELYDAAAQKEFANCHARADVTLEGDREPILRDVPVGLLLFLEKQLAELHSFVTKLPVLDPAEEWTYDSHASLYKTEPEEATRTKKVQRAIVLYPPTKEHPAQTQLITEDMIVGHWKAIRHSGALPQPLKAELLERVERFSKAVKVARETANGVEAPRQSIGRELLSLLFPA